MNITQDTLNQVKAAQQQPNDVLAKSISTATGLVAYDLQAPAKNLYPVMTPIRNTLPRVSGGTGLATNWRQISAITGSGMPTMPWVPEGQRTARMSYTTANKSASYVTIGEEDQISYEAISASAGFEDLRSTMVTRLLQQTMIKEEHAVIGGNASLALGTPAVPTITSNTTGGTIGAGTYNVMVVGLTYEGYHQTSVSGGVKTNAVITGADGNTYILNGGSSNKSAVGSSGALTTSTNTLSASVAAMVGAVAYAWYVGAPGQEVLQAITTINSVTLTNLITGTQNASAITADNSRNPNYAFDGLMTAAFASGSAYINTLAMGNAGVGTPLTGGGRGNVVEIDIMLKTLWDTYRVSPTAIYVNSQELKNITDKVLTNATAPLLRYDMSGSDPYGIVGNGVITAYFNPFSVNGGLKIPVMLHPFIPAGTILAHCANLPVQYQNNHVPNVAEIKTRRDFYQIDWPLRTRQQEVGVYCEEVLAVYAPFGIGIITNIGNG